MAVYVTPNLSLPLTRDHTILLGIQQQYNPTEKNKKLPSKNARLTGWRTLRNLN